MMNKEEDEFFAAEKTIFSDLKDKKDYASQNIKFYGEA